MTTAFETEFARSIYEQRYKHPHDGNWEGTARRVVTHPLAALEARTGKDLSSWASEIFKLFLAKKAVPGGRYLYATGRELHQVNNCFSGDTRFITKNGPRSLQDAVGEEVEVRNRFGEWEAAEVRPFGEQELYIVRFSNGFQVKTTANHLWWQEDGTRVSTLNLQEVPFSLAASMPDLDPEGVRHGIIYGDGFLSNEGRYSKIVFVNPEKDQALVDWFADEDREIAVGGGAVVNYRTVRQYKAGTCVALQPAHYKALPEACTPEYARGFIAGLIATDGTVPETGSVSISQEGLAACERIAELAVLAGCVVNSVRCVSTRSPYTGERRELGMVSIKPFSAPVILPSHVARIQARNLRQNFKMGLTVEEVSPTGETAPVYCVVAPQSESFTLANGLITSNCVLLRCPDSREGWATTSYQAEMALMTGAGIGVYYGDVRPGGSVIRKTGGTASGPLPKMQQVNETGRHTMQGGNRRCLPSGTLVHTTAGLIPIEQVNSDHSALTFDGFRRVVANVSQGEQPTVTINTQMGPFVCTPNHKVAVLTSVEGDYDWKRADELTQGDRMMFVPEVLPGTDTELPAFTYDRPKYSSTCTDILLPELDTEIAWLLGILAGDGCVHLSDGEYRGGAVQISIAPDLPATGDRAAAALRRFGVNAQVIDGDGCKVVSVKSRQLAEYFSQFKRPHTSVSVPECVLRGTPEIRGAWIAGLMDADGSVKTRPIQVAGSVYPDFLRQVQAVLASLGVVSRMKLIRAAQGNWQDLYTLDVVSRDQVSAFVERVSGFGHKIPTVPQGAQFDYSVPYAMAAAAGVRPHNNASADVVVRHLPEDRGYVPIKVVSVSEGSVHETFDIQVEDRNEFIAQGLLVHNSAIWAGLPWNHADVFDFITIKDWSDEVKAMKAKDWTFPAPMDMTNISVCLDDAFFEAYHNENWSNGTAIAPDGGTWHNWARRVYDTAIQHMLKHGEPGFSVDVGDKADEKLRNAPVVGSTRVLTDTGYVAVSEIVGQPVTVWTGLQWAPNVVFSENQRPDHTVEVAMTGGRSITCDPSHPFVLATGENLAAGELVPGTELLVSLPEVDVTGTLDNDAYTLGWLYGDGSFTKEGRAELTLCSDESKLCREWLSEPKSETRNDSRGYHRIYYGAGYPYTKDRVDPSIFRFTADQLVSFIAGLWDADGNYDSTQQRIRLSSKHEGFLRDVGLLLEQLGIVAHVSKNGTSTYGKSQCYQLCVAADYHDLFAEIIPCKRVRLAARWSSPYRKSKIKVLSVSTRPAEPVYCADVKVIEHMFVAEGVVIKNCTEITSADDSDVCNLGSLVLPRFESPEEFGRAVRAMVVFLTAGSVYSDVPYAKISEIRDSNRRLGLGLIGVHEFCMKRGVRYGTPEAFEILEPYMAEYRRALEYANEFQDSIGISRSVGATAIAPNGTIGIIAESTPSADPLFSAAERREVKVAHHSGKDEYTSHIVVDPVAKRLLSEGVPASLIEDAYTLSYDPERRFAMTAYLQQSVDHAISGTVNLPAVVTNEREAKGFGRTLLPYLPQMRGITVYPDGARAGQPRTSVDLEWAIENEGQLFTDDATCSGGVCGV